jgi:cell fate (sporulation/competence/biofilm development) regulator YmcA (YheA/YmcA/DUF963 family)
MDFLKNIFGSGTNIFGAGSNIDTEAYKQAGLLNQADVDKAGNQSLMRGLLGAGMSYLAQPQNKNYGTITPYLGKALQEGMTQAQKPYDNLTSNIEQTRKLQEYTEAEEQEKRMKDFRAGYGKNNMKVTVNKPGGVDSRLQRKDQNGNVTQVAPDFNAPEETQEEIEWFSKQKYLLKALQNNTISLEDYEKYSALPEGFTLDKDQVRYDANGKPIAGNVGNKWAEVGQTTAEGMIGTINEDFAEYEKLQNVSEMLQNPDFEYYEGNFGDWKEKATKFFQNALGTNFTSDQMDEWLANTENLNAMLQMDVFRAIKELGIGARGLDTPAERDFLIKVMTGNATVSRNALIQLTNRRRDKAKKKVDLFNQAEGNGYFKGAEGKMPGYTPGGYKTKVISNL